MPDAVVAVVAVVALIALLIVLGEKLSHETIRVQSFEVSDCPLCVLCTCSSMKVTPGKALL